MVSLLEHLHREWLGEGTSLLIVDYAYHTKCSLPQDFALGEPFIERVLVSINSGQKFGSGIDATHGERLADAKGMRKLYLD